MYGKQMELFNDGGLYDEGGMIDEVSGNDVPPGSTRKEVRDDIPAMLSEGEFVFPADVVRYFGLEKLMEMRQEAKMGMKKMEAMGQMGNSEEATIPDDLPFSPEDLIIMEPQEFARGGIVRAQAGTFVQPSGFEDTSLNTPNFIPPSSVAPINPQGTPTGYLPTFVGQSVIAPTGQNQASTSPGSTGTTDTTANTGTNFVPTVNDIYTFRKYRNPSTGEIREFSFYMGQPVIPIPDGFEPYTEEETTETEDVTVEETIGMVEPTQESGGDRDGTDDTPPGKSIGEMNAEELAEAAKSLRTMNTLGTAAAVAINPVFGGMMLGAARLQRSAITRRAEELGIANPLDNPENTSRRNIFDIISNIFNKVEEEETRTPPTGTGTRAPTTSPVPTTRPTRTPAEMTPAPTRDPFAGMSGADLLPPTAPTPTTPVTTEMTSAPTRDPFAGMTGADLLPPSRSTSDDRDDRPDTWSGGSTSVSQSTRERSADVQSGRSQAAGATSPSRDISSDRYSGKGYTSGRAKGGLIEKPNKTDKPTPSKNRGIAARKKK